MVVYEGTDELLQMNKNEWKDQKIQSITWWMISLNQTSTQAEEYSSFKDAETKWPEWATKKSEKKAEESVCEVESEQGRVWREHREAIRELRESLSVKAEWWNSSQQKITWETTFEYICLKTVEVCNIYWSKEHNRCVHILLIINRNYFWCLLDVLQLIDSNQERWSDMYKSVSLWCTVSARSQWRAMKLWSGNY